MSKTLVRNAQHIKIGDVFKTIKNYWNDQDTILFNNWIDASCGIITLFALPILSAVPNIIPLFGKNVSVRIDISFWQYGLLFLSISLGGICDSINRIGEGNKSNYKSYLRIFLNALAMILALIFSNGQYGWWIVIPPIILTISGYLVMKDALREIALSIVTSNWFCNKE